MELMDEKGPDRSRAGRGHTLALAAVAAASLAVIMGLAPARAGAQPEFPFNPSVGVSADDYGAGAHPNLTIRLTKPPNHCMEALFYQGDPTPYCDGWHEGTYYPAYIEQDFKRATLQLPAGLVADPNAAPVCNPRYIPEEEQSDELYACDPPVPPIGTVTGTFSNCVRNSTTPDDTHGCGNPEGQDPWAAPIIGDIYMGKREAGEQGRLVILAGAAFPADSGPGFSELIKHGAVTYTSIEVDPYGRITAETDNIPDTVRDPAMTTPIPIQPDQLWLTFWGATGAEAGHPVLTNPTSCTARQLAGEAQGYANNVVYESSEVGFQPGYGDGTTAPVAADFHATGCNEVPYAPTFDLKLDPPTPSAAPAIVSTITQARGEATTGRASVTFPKGFQINFDNKNAQCQRPDFEANACPDGSRIGEATARSELLPLDLARRELSGPVYLGETDLAAGNIKLYARLVNDEFLPTGIWVTGTATLQEDGTLVTVFDNLPELPMQSFTLSLDGGDGKALIRNPKTCGEKTVKSVFTSHHGRQVPIDVPVEIACTEPTFAAEVSTRRPRAHPTVTLTVNSAGLRSVGFDLSRHLKVRDSRRLDLLGRYGTLTLSTEQGPRELKLKLVKGGSLGSLAFSATEAGSQVTTLGAYDTSLSAKAKRRLSKRARRSRTRGATRLWLGGLPAGTTQVSLELEGKTNRLLRNPSNCRSKGRRLQLGFAARVVGLGGRAADLHRSVEMRCKASGKPRKG